MSQTMWKFCYVSVHCLCDSQSWQGGKTLLGGDMCLICNDISSTGHLSSLRCISRSLPIGPTRCFGRHGGCLAYGVSQGAYLSHKVFRETWRISRSWILHLCWLQQNEFCCFSVTFFSTVHFWPELLPIDLLESFLTSASIAWSAQRYPGLGSCVSQKSLPFL